MRPVLIHVMLFYSSLFLLPHFAPPTSPPHAAKQLSPSTTPLTHNDKLIHNVSYFIFGVTTYRYMHASLSYSSLALLFIPQKSILLQKQISCLPKAWMKSIPNTFIRDCPLQIHPSHLRQVSHVVRIWIFSHLFSSTFSPRYVKISTAFTAVD